MGIPLEDIKIEGKWYYVIVQNPGTDQEEFVGFNNDETNEKFLPAFEMKEAAEKCFRSMPKDVFSLKYEAQAVIAEDLFLAAKQGGHKVYLLNEDGKILNLLN